MLVEAVLVVLAVVALELGFTTYMFAESSRFVDFLTQWGSSNLGFEHVNHLVAQILLIQEFDNKAHDLHLSGPLIVTHESMNEVKHRVEQA